MENYYQESKEFWRPPQEGKKPSSLTSPEGLEVKLLQHVLETIVPNYPQKAIEGIDLFCDKNWMMNLGPEKARIVISALKKHKPKNILEIGGYCGYSALVLALHSTATVQTIEINEEYAKIAHKIHKHAGLSDRINIQVGTVSTLEQYLKQHGPYDCIFIDHVKHLYLADFEKLLEYGVIPVGAVAVGDNIICPGSPDYLKYFKNNPNYKSTLYHSYLEYTDVPDAVLVSERLS